MDKSEDTRERMNTSVDSDAKDDQSKLSELKTFKLQQYVTSGVVDKSFGPLTEKDRDLWLFRGVGSLLSQPEFKKVYWNANRKMKEKPSRNCSAPSDSGYPEDEDVKVIQEVRKVKPEDVSIRDRLITDGRKKFSPRSGSGGNSGKRKHDSLSPVSSITSSSVSPPNIGDMRNRKPFRERSKSPVKSRNSPVKSRSSPVKSRSSPVHNRYRRSPYRSTYDKSSSPSRRYDRSKSPSRRYGKSRSPIRRYGKSRSPSRRHNKSRSPSSHRSGKRSYSRLHSRSPSFSKEPLRKNYRSKSPVYNSKGLYNNEKKVWEIFRSEVDALEKERWSNEQTYKKNPEKHPDYKIEWKKFYKSRVKELESRGKDPKSYNFESEWAYFWKWKMDELLRTDFEAKKDAIRRKLKLPDDEPRSPHRGKANRSRGAGDDLCPSSVDRTQSGANTKAADCPGLIATLRIVTAVEEALGSLGPQVNGLLSQCVALLRIEGSTPESLLQNHENFVLLETVREKLMGQMQSKIVRKNLIGAVTEAIDSIDNLIKSVPTPDPSVSQNYLNALQSQVLHNIVFPAEGGNVTDLNVPGVGSVDRVAVAQQIAEVLVKQGKTDVTETELQELVNAVLGMAKTQANQEQSRESVSAHEQNIQSQIAPSLSVSDSSRATNFGQITGSEEVRSLTGSTSVTNTTSSGKDNSALGLLMSVVQSGAKTPFVPFRYESDESDTEFSKDKIVLKQFSGFKMAAREFRKNHDNMGKIESDFKGNSEESTKPVLKNYSFSKSKPWNVQGQNTKGNQMVRRLLDGRLSPFSSRKESSNPLPSDEDKDLKIIGAWDSDSDIDLDATEKTKAPAYEKVCTKTESSERNINNSPVPYKPPNEPESKDKDTSTSSQNQIVSISSAIDDLMGSLRKKSEKQSSSGEQISIISPSSERLAQAKGGGFPSSQQGANATYATYNPQSIPTQLSQPQLYGNAAAYGNQYYGGQSVPNCNQYAGVGINQYNPAAYQYPQSNQPIAQNYYGGYGQMNPAYPGYYNYQSNYAVNPDTQAHSTNYQVHYH